MNVATRQFLLDNINNGNVKFRLPYQKWPAIYSLFVYLFIQQVHTECL